MSRIEDKTVKYKGITKRYYRFLYCRFTIRMVLTLFEYTALVLGAYCIRW